MTVKTILLEMHPVFSFFLRHLLNGIAEGGARHFMGMLAKKFTQEVHADVLTHLAKHPANSLVHQVVRVMQVDFGIAQAP